MLTQVSNHAPSLSGGATFRSSSLEDPKDATSTIRPSDLPAPPAAAARIVEACADASVGAQGLARIVASDPVLTMEILRIVNSAYFGLGREVKSAIQAVTVLGNRALRNVALCLAVRDAVRPGAIPGLDLMSYWEDGLRRAVGARLLGKATGFDPEEAFTIGLLQDFGLLAMFHAFPGLGSHWTELRSLDPDERRRREQVLFGNTHDQVGLMLAKAWALPAGLALPMACHHASATEDLPPQHREACRVASAADVLAAVFSSAGRPSTVARARVAVGEWFSLTPRDVDAILEQLPAGVEEAAQSLGLRVPQQPRFEEVMVSANRALVAANLSYQELTWKLEHALAEQRRLAAELEQANQQLEQLAYFDALTELVNRRRFHEVFAAEVARHSRTGLPLTLVVLDLDNFKVINDTYGHPFGDTVLAAVARVLRAVLRQTDVKARVGGEELAILLPDTAETPARNTVERLRAAIETMALKTPTRRVSVTASFGCCAWQGSAVDRAAVESVTRSMFELADRALYEAKKAGRNCVAWRAFAPYGSIGPA